MNYFIIFKNDQVKSVHMSSNQIAAMVDKINNGNAVIIGGSVYHGWEIKRIMTEEDYQAWISHNNQKDVKKDRQQILMSGQWQCRYGYLHPRKEECGHDIQYGGRKSTEEEFDQKVNNGEYDWIEGDTTEYAQKYLEMK